MKVAIFGGDKRMLFAAGAFANEGYEVYAAGFDHLISLCEIRLVDYRTAAEQCDAAVLPVRPISDGFLNTPFSEEKIPIGELIQLIGDKPIFSGFSESVAPYSKGRVYDYSADEYFAVKNAELTAEGTVGILVNDYEGSVCDTDILVTGYGRIGKLLSVYLKQMGAHVTVAARKLSARDSIIKSGLSAADFSSVDYAKYQVVINTVPAPVIDNSAVDKMRDDVFIIDLASLPGGVDLERVKDRDLSCIHALALPGKTAPLAAGTIIKDTIINMLSR